MKLEARIKLDKFQPRPYQRQIFDAIENKGYKRVLAILPRRAGKDVGVVIIVAAWVMWTIYNDSN